jgi:hypothetical protein
VLPLELPLPEPPLLPPLLVLPLLVLPLDVLLPEELPPEVLPPEDVPPLLPPSGCVVPESPPQATGLTAGTTRRGRNAKTDRCDRMRA